MPTYVCQSDAIKLCACGMGGSPVGACGYDYGEEALRAVDTPGHKKYGWCCFRDAGVSSNQKNKTDELASPTNIAMKVLFYHLTVQKI